MGFPVPSRKPATASWLRERTLVCPESASLRFYRPSRFSSLGHSSRDLAYRAKGRESVLAALAGNRNTPGAFVGLDRQRAIADDFVPDQEIPETEMSRVLLKWPRAIVAIGVTKRPSVACQDYEYSFA